MRYGYFLALSVAWLSCTTAITQQGNDQGGSRSDLGLPGGDAAVDPDADSALPVGDTGRPVGDTGLPIQTLSYDLVIAGGGSGGIAAALEAARLGRSVALLEETDWLGGQMTAAAVANMDETGSNRESGIYAEFIGLVKTHYDALGKSIGTCYWRNNSQCFEPKEGQVVLEQMLASETSIDIFRRTHVTEVLNATVGGRPRVSGVLAVQRSSNGSTLLQLNAKIVIDATEHGDLLPLSPARFRAGNTTSDSLDINACVQENTYTAVIKKYPLGPPSQLVMSSPPPGYTQAIKDKFANVVAINGDHWLDGLPRDYPVDWLTHVGYRGMPDSTNTSDYDSLMPQNITRTGVNWANDHEYKVADLDPTTRTVTNCAAKLLTLQFLYYVQTELNETQWAIANDEGFDTPYNVDDNSCTNIPAQFKTIERHFPVMPYVRESRRMIGVTTVTASQIKRVKPCPTCPAVANQNFPSALAVGDYPVDLHGCSANTDLELALENENDKSGSGVFQVPFESFIPENTDGLLAAEKNISVTRLVNGAIRLQPITMLTGQAVGAIAALSIERGVQPRVLPPILVQDVLAKHQSRLSLKVYPDVPRSNPLWPSVQVVSARQIIMGYASSNNFGPQDTMPRDQAAVVLARLFQLDISNPPSTPTFGDVPTSHWSYAHVEALFAAGLTNGCATTPVMYCPDQPLTREAAATILCNGMGCNPANAPSTPIFSDLDDTRWSFPYVQLMAQKGVLSGCSATQFCPLSNVTRGEMAQAAHHVLVLLASP